jgi:hypothetical protein
MPKTPDGKLFVKLFLDEADTRAMDTSVSPHVRAFLLAVARAEPNGHAQFARGALAKQLCTPNGQPRRNVGAVIAQAVVDGLLDPVSRPECLVLTRLALPHSTHGYRRRDPCPTHGGTAPATSMAQCHPNRRHKAHGLCQSCYQLEWTAGKEDGRDPCWSDVLARFDLPSAQEYVKDDGKF